MTGSKNSEKIQKTLDLIKNQIGLTLNLCDCFPGMHKRAGMQYFNVVLNEPTFFSRDFNKLVSASNYLKIKVSENGDKRVAIYINKDI